MEWNICGGKESHCSSKQYSMTKVCSQLQGHYFRERVAGRSSPVSESEVARLLRQIDQEFEAAQQGLTGLAQRTALHAFISAKMKRVRVHQDELAVHVGEDEAIRLVYERYASIME
jgi:hypothetical protein